jgi:hypothetical protein
MAAAAATLPRPPIYGIGQLHIGTKSLDFEVGWDEFERDVDWAETQMRSAGLESGDLVLLTLDSWELPWTGPVVHALRRIGVIYLTAEVWSFDARRTSMFLQRLPVKAIFGLGGETLSGLESQEPPIPELLENVQIVWARMDAMARLAGTAPKVSLFVRSGPALALGLPDVPGVVVNAAEWTVDVDDGELVVSNTRERATAFERIPTGVRGSVISVRDGAITLDIEWKGQ